MAITEAALYEAFHLDVPETTGTEAAEPEETAAAEGAQDQDTAEPEQMEQQTDNPEDTESDADSDEGEETPTDSEGADGGKETLTPKQRHANAARRRQAQQQEAIRQAVDAAVQAQKQQHDTEIQSVLAQSGLKNTVTGEAITNLEQLKAWGQQMVDARLEGDLKRGKLTKETLDQLITSHPTVQQAQQVVQQVQAQQEQQRQAEEQNRIQNQLAEIGKLNPAVKSLADILAMDTAPAFRDNVAKGMDFLDAYRLANMEAMAEAKAQRAATAAGNKARGKEHLVAAGNSRGSGAASVPPAQMKLYRKLNPKMTDAQIQAHYNHYIKQGG